MQRNEDVNVSSVMHLHTIHVAQCMSICRHAYAHAICERRYIRPKDTTTGQEQKASSGVEDEPASLYVFPTVLVFTELNLEDG